MKTLLLTDPMPSGYFSAAVHAVAADVPLIDFRSDITDAELADIEVVLGWRFPHGVAGRLPNLKWVCSVAAGVEKLLVPDLAAHVPVSRIVDTDQAEGIAQFVALMALRHARKLSVYEAQQLRHDWSRKPMGAVRSRVSVLGTGTMGGAVARLLAALGFEVRGWSRRTGESLDTVLGSSDIVVCALPLTAETDAILNARSLALMPQGGYLINIARGAHVVESDLIDAVRCGHLAGAALDVQQNEPMAAGDPLWDVPGITITPHIAAQSSPQTIASQFVAGLRALQRGEEPPQTVDRQRGY